MKEIKLEASIEKVYVDGRRTVIISEQLSIIEGALIIKQDVGEVPSAIKKIRRITNIVGPIRDDLDLVLATVNNDIKALVDDKQAKGGELTKEEVDAINTLKINKINEVFNKHGAKISLEDSDAEFLYKRMIQTKYKFESEVIENIVSQLKPE